MAKKESGTTTQIVMSEPSKIFKEKYLTKKGKRLLMNKILTKKEVWAKYGKNRYVKNPDAFPVKEIIHHNQ